MYLKKIVLNDFKCYEGTQTIEFAPPQESKSIALIGGKNGAGKTSLLKAIGMCLYGGEGAFKHRVLRNPADPDAPVAKRKEEIRNELRSILNKTALQCGRLQAKVTLGFETPDGSVEFARTWKYDRTGELLDERLEVVRDGQALREYHEEESGEVYSVEENTARTLETFFPTNIGKFFLFDGEDIQRLAQEELEEEIVKGVDQLLGFNVLKLLEQDLAEMTDRYRHQHMKSQENEIRALEHLREVKQLEVDRAKAARRQEELTSLLDEHREELDALMERVGPFLADGRGSGSNLQEELDRAVVRSRALDEQILGALETVIVPAIPSSLTAQLLKRLDGEARFASWTEGKRKVEPQLDKLCASIFGPGADKPTPPLTEGQRRFLEQLLRREWENLFHPPPPDVAPDPRHDRLAPAELDAVRAKLQEVLHGSTVDLGTVLEEREALSRRIMDLESRINAVAEGDELNAMLSRRDDLNRRIGELQAQFDEVIRQLAFIDQNLGEKRRQHAQATREAQGDGVPAPERLRFCNDLQEIVRKFQERRRPQKVREVKDRLIEMFRCLARKEDVIQDISIDDKTFHIRLLDRRQKQVPMRDLSAGEKEIFAISLLWALGNASGRKLPVVIDTPLARLDRDHRQNIVRRYLPHAGTQVLILSTDTELDTQYLQYIEGSIANKYRLVFDNQAERTRIEPGYF